MGDTERGSVPRAGREVPKQDWIDIKADGDALRERSRASGRVNRLMTPTNFARHRASIERFYDCGDEMHRSLVQMYLADERFTRYCDDVEPGRRSSCTTSWSRPVTLRLL